MTVTIPSTYLVEDSSKDSHYRTQETQYGDGYTAIAPDGINTKETDVSVTFTLQTQTEANALEALLDQAYGVDTISWIQPGDSVASLWRVKSFRKKANQGKTFQISCVFKRIYSP